MSQMAGRNNKQGPGWTWRDKNPTVPQGEGSELFWIFKVNRNMGMQISLRDSDFISFGYISGSGAAGSCGSSIYNFLKNLHHFL